MNDVTFILTDPVLKIVGGYKMVYTYANALIREGFNVRIIYRKYFNKSNFVIDLADTFIRFIITHSRIKWFPLSKKIKREFKIKIHKPFSNQITIVTALPTAKEVYEKHLCDLSRTVYLIQDYENWGVSDDIVNQSYNYGYKMIAVSKWLQKKVEEISKEDCIHISNGIDLSVFNTIIPIENRNNYSIAMLYHTQERKGTKDGLKALKELHDIYPQIRVELFGSPSKPDDLPEWMHYTQNASQEEVASIMNKSAIFLCCSKIEGYGLTGLESMACGCALVSTPCEGVLDYATNGKDSLITDGFDSKAMANEIEKLINNPDQRIQIAKEAQNTVLDFSKIDCEKRFVDFIKSL